jgi:hypothetical protein
LGPIAPAPRAKADWKNFDIVINEVLFYADAGGDTGLEWVELYNRGPDTVDTYDAKRPNSITITINAATNSAGFDFLHFDLSGIKNATVAKEFGSSGYTVKVETIDVSDNNKVIESLTSMPIFITRAGNNIKIKIDRGALSGSKAVDKLMIKETT